MISAPNNDQLINKHSFVPVTLICASYLITAHPLHPAALIRVRYQMKMNLIHGVTINSHPCQLAPCQLVPMSTRTTNRCQLVPQVMSTRTQQGKYQMMVRIDIYYHTIDVNSYPCQLVPISTRTTKRCQLVPSSDVNSYQS